MPRPLPPGIFPASTVPRRSGPLLLNASIVYLSRLKEMMLFPVLIEKPSS